MIERAVIATRQFAKRQYTWLRREHEAWAFASEDADLVKTMLACIEPML
jgi:tRNA dimethylallyltransferase